MQVHPAIGPLLGSSHFCESGARPQMDSGLRRNDVVIFLCHSGKT